MTTARPERSTPARTPRSSGGISHPFDYNYRPGMPLRPWPERATESRHLWESSRRRYVEPMVEPERLADPSPLIDLVADHQWEGDELMDDTVRAFRRVGMQRGRQMLQQALDHGIETVDDPPEELVRLFASLDNPPAWFDPQRWERGRQLWVCTSFAGKTGMAVQDALATFVGNDVSTATAATRRFINDYQRRMFESYTWFWNVTLENAMDRYSPFFKDTVKVRLMHSQVRAGMRRSWDDERFAREGSPISATSMLLGAISFGILPMLIDLAHGRHHSAADLDDAMLNWAQIAYVFGVPEHIIPTTAADGIEIMNYFLPYTGGPTRGTEEMAGAAAEHLSEDGKLTPSGTMTAAPLLGMMAYFGGKPATRALIASTPAHDIHIAPWVRVVGALVSLNIAINKAVDKLPFREARLGWRGRKGDRFWRINVVISRISARKNGIHSTPYDHHDGTPATPAGCPIQ